ncbi:MAG TPA: hypothetical protein VE890_02980, partial [Thermoguttaceae bacterium]|nr:hypothetical protein [Thermoguttaceae bacterium]
MSRSLLLSLTSGLVLVLACSVAVCGEGTAADTIPSNASAVSPGPEKPSEGQVDKSGDQAGEQQKTRSRSKKKKSSGYTSWKRHLPFWPRKGWLLAELSLFITLGVLFAQILEVSGAMKIFALLAWPVIKLGRLGDAASAALLMSVQSGAVANGMLVSSRDRGDLNNRQLYTSVLVVSCLSLFAHLPTYIV